MEKIKNKMGIINELIKKLTRLNMNVSKSRNDASQR